MKGVSFVWRAIREGKINGHRKVDLATTKDVVEEAISLLENGFGKLKGGPTLLREA